MACQPNNHTYANEKLLQLPGQLIKIITIILYTNVVFASDILEKKIINFCQGGFCQITVSQTCMKLLKWDITKQCHNYLFILNVSFYSP